jgi:hypothetical protein
VVAWRWILRDESGGELRETESWESRTDAEGWLSQNWQVLLEEGAEAVSLVEDSREEYTMGLREE